MEEQATKFPHPQVNTLSTSGKANQQMCCLRKCKAVLQKEVTVLRIYIL